MSIVLVGLNHKTAPVEVRERLAFSDEACNSALQTLIQHTHSATAALGNLYGLILQQSTVMAYADAQWALGALTFFLLPLVFVLPRRRKGAAAPVNIPAE